MVYDLVRRGTLACVRVNGGKWARMFHFDDVAALYVNRYPRNIFENKRKDRRELDGDDAYPADPQQNLP